MSRSCYTAYNQLYAWLKQYLIERLASAGRLTANCGHMLCSSVVRSVSILGDRYGVRDTAKVVEVQPKVISFAGHNRGVLHRPVPDGIAKSTDRGQSSSQSWWLDPV